MLIVLTVLEGAAFVALRYAQPWPWPLLPLVVFGMAFTGVTFHAIYYAAADPDRVARSVGINESLVGIGSILGPLLLGWLAWNNVRSWRPYAGGTILAIGVTAVLLSLPVRNRRRAAAQKPM